MRGPQLTQLSTSDPVTAWESAGFSVSDGAVAIDSVLLRCDAMTGGHDGIASWSFERETADVIDGVLTHEAAAHGTTGVTHRNGVIEIDHLVMMSPDGERTIAALRAVGFEDRRTREFERGDRQMRQTFFWMGDTILELGWEAGVEDPGPATLWGIALTVADLDATAAELGELCSEPRTAVQPGRRVATLRTRELGISIPTLFISPHPD